MNYEFGVSKFLRSHLEVPSVGLGLADRSPNHLTKSFLGSLLDLINTFNDM